MDIIPEPKHNVVMDSQILSSLMACPQAADYNFNQDLQPNGGKSVSLEMGSIVHQFLEHKFKAQLDGMKKADAIGFGMAAAIKYSKDKTEVRNSSDEDIGIALNTCIEYENYYKVEPWRTLEVESVHGREIYNDGKLRVIWKAKFDWIVDNGQMRFAVDHKTMKQRRDVTNLNNQFTGQVLLTDQRLMFVNKIGFQQSLAPKDKFTRAPVNYTQARLDEWSQVIVPFYARKLVEYANTGFWPRNYTHCESKYGFCKYKEVCESNPNMRPEVIRLNFYKGKKWDIGSSDTE